MSNAWKLYKYLGKKCSLGGNITLSDENVNPIALDPYLNAETLLHRYFPDDGKRQENQYHKNTGSPLRTSSESANPQTKRMYQKYAR